jgi:hypothetical protein
LIGALDSTLVRKKIAVAMIATLALGLLFAFTPLDPLNNLSSLATSKQGSFDRAWTALAMIVVGSIATAHLTRMTFVEVSRLRPAKWSEAFHGLTGLTIRLSVAQLFVTGLTLLLVECLRISPVYFLHANPFQDYVRSDVLATIAVVVAMVAEVLQWPVFGLSMLLAPILAVEGCGIGGALLQWFRLVRRQFGRAFVYQALAVGVGVAITLPLLVPLVTLAKIYDFREIRTAIDATRTVLVTMAVGPLFAYLFVANVFIYLNLRYETAVARK